jgi:hypothetical protein
VFNVAEPLRYLLIGPSLLHGIPDSDEWNMGSPAEAWSRVLGAFLLACLGINAVLRVQGPRRSESHGAGPGRPTSVGSRARQTADDRNPGFWPRNFYPSLHRPAHFDRTTMKHIQISYQFSRRQPNHGRGFRPGRAGSTRHEGFVWRARDLGAVVVVLSHAGAEDAPGPIRTPLLSLSFQGAQASCPLSASGRDAHAPWTVSIALPGG